MITNIVNILNIDFSLNYDDNSYDLLMVYNIKVIISSLLIAFGILFYLYYNLVDYIQMLYIIEGPGIWDFKYSFLEPPINWIYFVGHIPDMFLILLLIPTCLMVKRLLKNHWFKFKVHIVRRVVAFFVGWICFS